jgi:hypothetical protein
LKTLIAILVIFFCLSPSIDGQDYIPFPTKDVNWNIYLETTCDINIPPDTFLLRYTLHGDTTFNEAVYNKLFVEKGDTVNPKMEAVGGIREKDKRVYYFGQCFLGSDTEKEFLLYDFNVQIGDTIMHSSDGHWKSIVLDIDSIQIVDHYRKRYKVNNGWYYHNPDYIVEGIGSVINGLLGHISNIPTCGIHYWEHVCYKENGQVLYQNPTYGDCYAGVNLSSIGLFKEFNIRLFPNPFYESIQVNIPNEERDLSLRLYSCQGQLIVEKEIIETHSQISIPGPSGIYIAILMDTKGMVYFEKIIKN